MDNEMFSRMTEMSQNAWKPFVELGEITTRAMERAGQQQMTLINEALQDSARYTQNFTDVKDVKELVELQSRLMTEVSEKLFSVARQNVDNAMQTGSELSKWFETSINIQAAVKPAVRSAARKSA
ncbi:MAG: phasin family protein [Gammaproteobacteria bacterium]|nr:phasin family protein [Gammaproteobacteria bacterium]